MRWLAIVIPQLMLAASLSAETPCVRPLSEWKEKEAKKLLTDSPWSQKTVFAEMVRRSALDEDGEVPGNEGPRAVIDGSRGYGADKGSGLHGEKELYYTYTCRLYSALPVRQAHVRLWQAQSKYEQMSVAEQRAFDKKVEPLLLADTSQVIVVTIQLTSNDRRKVMEFERRLRETTTELLREAGQSATGRIEEQAPYLISDHLGRIPLQAYYPPSGDGVGAKLVFPRQIDGEPIVLTKDKELKLEMIVPGTTHKLYVLWKVRDLMCNGEPIF